jgi:hypothetical protein
MLLLCWSVAYAVHQRLIVSAFFKDFLKEVHVQRHSFVIVIGGKKGDFNHVYYEHQFAKE